MSLDIKNHAIIELRNVRLLLIWNGLIYLNLTQLKAMLCLTCVNGRNSLGKPRRQSTFCILAF